MKKLLLIPIALLMSCEKEPISDVDDIPVEVKTEVTIYNFNLGKLPEQNEAEFKRLDGYDVSTRCGAGPWLNSMRICGTDISIVPDNDIADSLVIHYANTSSIDNIHYDLDFREIIIYYPNLKENYDYVLNLFGATTNKFEYNGRRYQLNDTKDELRLFIMEL